MTPQPVEPKVFVSERDYRALKANPRLDQTWVDRACRPYGRPDPSPTI